MARRLCTIFHCRYQTLEVRDSTFINNRGGRQGALACDGGLIINSTFTGNSASCVDENVGQGGALTIEGGTLNVINSTFSGNSAAFAGGAISVASSATANLTNTTITDNRTSFDNALNIGGGGISNRGTVNMRNTIVAGNSTARANTPPDFDGTITSHGNNIIGHNLGATGVTDGINNDQVGSDTNAFDVRLAPLANNGGPTQTHALLPGSPAIDAGNNCVTNNTCPTNSRGFSLTTDQRGLARRFDGDGNGTATVDIGAYESLVVTPSVNVDRTDDTNSAAGAVCSIAPNDCSLRGAVAFANANPGTTIKLHAERLQVAQLPGYSPDYNPIEKLWKKIKQHETHLHYFATYEALTAKVESAMLKFMQKQEEILALCGLSAEQMSAGMSAAR